MDVVKDFKLNALDFNDDLKNKNIAFQKMCQSKCLNCPKLPENVSCLKNYNFLFMFFSFLNKKKTNINTTKKKIVGNNG